MTTRRDILKAAAIAPAAVIPGGMVVAQTPEMTDGFGQISETTPAEAELQALSFEREVMQVADGVWAALNYAVSNVGIVETPNGLIIIDTTEEPAAATVALRQIRRRAVDKPVLAIIYTHSHVDHIGGAEVFAGHTESEEPIQVWATDNFGISLAAGEFATIASIRGPRQAGFSLPEARRFNQGIAIAKAPFGTFGAGSMAPTDLVTEQRKSITIDGVTLELVKAPGETDDQMYVWYPERRVLFGGDNYYASFPNLYAIRGTQYRDVSQWAFAVRQMAAEAPDVVVPGHTRPLMGSDECATVLTNYANGIQSIWDQTVAGISRGHDPDTLAATVALPEELAELPYLREYYGSVANGVRSIYSGHLGWFDGNATNLFRSDPATRAARHVALMGGADAVLSEAHAAWTDGQAQWASELCDYLLAAEQAMKPAMLLKASALEDLSREQINVLSRNYLQVFAAELRTQAERM